MLMPLSASALNIRAATPAWLRMPMPMTDTLATSAELLTSKSPMSLLGVLQDLERARQLGRLHGEGHVGVLAVRRDVLHDHVDVDVGVGQRAENAAPRRRLVLDLEQA